MLAAVILAGALAALAWFVKGDLGEFRRFKALVGSDARRTRYRLWIAKAALAFALPALVGLTVLGRLGAIVAMPAELQPVAAMLPAFAGSSFFSGMLGGAAVSGLAAGLWIAWRRRRGRPGPPPTIGNTAALLPRNRAELWHGVALSISAGVTEELAFRLFLPLLIALVTGNALLAVAVAAALFGAMHLYQGWLGVVATTVVGLMLSFVYLASGSLALAMLIHTLIDLNGLVVRPIMGGAWRVRSSAASPS